MKLQLSDFENKDNISIKQEIVGGRTLSIVSYIFNDPELWKDPINLEARGITFDENGKIVSRTLPKFFNLGEREETQFNVLDFSGAEYFEKLDGSLITPVFIDDKIYFKTKKSFYSDVAKACQKDFGDDERYIDFIEYCDFYNMTPIFEYTSPMNRIVVDYGQEPKLTLLAIRYNQSGEYMPYQTMVKITQDDYDPIPVVKKYNINSIQDVLKEDIENREGYVVVLKSGQRVKIKFPSYLMKHRTLDRMTERNIAQMVLEECIDDFKALVDPRHIPKIEEIEHRVILELELIEKLVEGIVAHWVKEEYTLVEIGKLYSNNPYFNCAIMVYKGKEIDEMVKRHYTSKMLPTLDNVQLW